jgi:phage/plasmid-like protein (TIGR03299 family)
MAHEIYINEQGAASMAYLLSGGVPWHKLGTGLPDDATDDQWRVASGMDWEIRRADVHYTDTDGQTRVMKDRLVLFRSDTGAALSVVSDRYKAVQPGQVLDFFRETAGGQGWNIETAGVLREGRQFWALARTPVEISGADETRLYTLFSTSADGSLATSVTGTAVRVVCANTLGMALRGSKGRELKIRHNTAFDPKTIQRELGMVDLDSTWAAFGDQMRKLAGVEVSRSDATRIFSELLRPGYLEQEREAVVLQDVGAVDFAGLLSAPRRISGVSERIKVSDDGGRAIRGLMDLEESYISAPGACPGSGYGVLQGATHYLDHVRGGSDRLASAWFGQGANLKDRAQELILSGDWRASA